MQPSENAANQNAANAVSGRSTCETPAIKKTFSRKRLPELRRSDFLPSLPWPHPRGALVLSILGKYIEP